MNTHSFVSQSKKSHRIGGSTGTTAKAQIAHHLRKRWQPKPEQTRQNASASRLSPAEQDALMRQQALTCAQQGETAEAIALFSELIERHPDSAIDYSNRGLVHFQDGQLDEAIADYDKAIELNPLLDSVYNNRANYYAAQGQYLEAILDYDVALDLNPANIRAWINQGITFRELEMYDRALESFDMALCLNRLEGHIYAERGRTYHLRGDWNCAIADYQKALAKLPQPMDAVRNSSVRLRLHVGGWMTDLLSLSLEEDEAWKL
ncbi:MAG TPA: tetratricopeptide repeat protein [Coleofasciculaceae cyanobacterium]